MPMMPWKMFRRKTTVSRDKRAEEYSKRIRLTTGAYKGLVPRLGLALVFVVVTLVLFAPQKRTKDVLFKVGEIADRSVIAPFDFEVPLSDEDLNLERASAALVVLPVYVRDPSAENDLISNFSTDFDSLSHIVSNDTLDIDQKVRWASGLFPSLSTNMLRELVDPTVLSAIRTGAVSFQEEIFKRGFIDNAGPLRRRIYTSISAVHNGSERRLPASDLVDQGKIDGLIRERGFARFKKNRTRAMLFYEVVRNHLLPNLVFNTAMTEERRQRARDAVRKTITVSKNQRIIGEHDKVSADQVETLLALEKTRASMESQKSPLVVVSLYTAEILRLVLFALLFGGYIAVFHRRVYRDLARLSAVLTVWLIYVVFMAVVIRFSLSEYLIPVAFVSLTITALFDYKLGLVTTVFACFLVPLVTNVAPNVGFVSLLAGSVAVIGLMRMRSRSHFFSVFMLVSGAYVVAVISTELGQIEQFQEFSRELGWSVCNGLFSTLTAMFLLPIFESVFNLTTRFTLLELTDLNKPILKRLNMEAPGTYHHSMLLGSLVDAVAGDVGADPLLARVMAYYHDIGKIFKPEYFVENQESGFNKHEKITPQMSSLILLSHVKDGAELAREEKLPDLIIDAICQHHGTTVMAFFYQKALETDSHSSVNQDDFRYPGPKPQSKEAATLMLADTVEPACRSLHDPNPAHIRNMVVKLINLRAHDGELDCSGLTLNDLARIREKFVSILSGIYHKRVAYPGQEKEDEKQGEAIAKPVGG